MRSPLRNVSVSQQWFNRLVIGAVVLGFVSLVVAGVAAALAMAQNQRQVQWVDHTYRVERTIARLRVVEERLEAARRGYLLVTDPGIAATFAQSATQVQSALADLRRLTVDNAAQRANIAEASKLAERQLVLLRRSFDLVRQGRRTTALAELETDGSVQLIRAIRASADRMLAEEDRLLAERNAAQAAGVRHFYVILGLTGLLLLGVGTASVWVIQRYTRDLATSRDALAGLNANLEGAVRERTTDLQRANDEIQRFAYIVSHDLRSPLVNVMGFTAELEASTKTLATLIERIEEAAPELLDADAREAAQVDLPEAIGFIRTSTQKMDRLINAILRLSREGRRPITPEPLDMNALAHSIADTLKHRIDEVGVTFVIDPGLPAITSDRLAIEQILSNLVENAVKYRAPDRPGHIELGGRIERGRALFTIADNGRGIAPKDHDRIFDLFRRSGVQDQPGEGIGLAHTRALAYRLGGTITVDSRLGEGATFTVNLPRIFSADQGALS